MYLISIERSRFWSNMFQELQKRKRVKWLSTLILNILMKKMMLWDVN